MLVCQHFKRQAHKMVQHTQTIRRLLPRNCLSVFAHFVGLTLKWLKLSQEIYRQRNEEKKGKVMFTVSRNALI